MKGQRVLPNGWSRAKLGDLCRTTSGGTPSRRKPEYFIGSIPWVKSGELNDGLVTSTEECISNEAVEKSNAKVFPQGTLLIAMYGATVGKVGILGKEAATNQAVCAVFPPPQLDTDFLFWFLKSIRSDLVDISAGGAQPNISQKIVRDIDIPLPYPDDPVRSLAEQQRIVARIEALFAELREAHRLHEEVVADTGRLMEAVLAEVFNPDVTSTWPYEDPLGQLVDITASLVDPTLPEYRDLPHIHGQVVEEGTGRLLEYHSAAEDGMRSNKYLFRPGSVVYSKIRPYLRKVTLVDFQGLCSADMYPIEVKKIDALIPEFLMWALLSPNFTDYANSVSGRARIPKINRPQLFAYHLPYPDVDTQKAIAHHLKSTQAEVTEMQKAQAEAAELLKQVEQAILTQAFRGEL